MEKPEAECFFLNNRGSVYFRAAEIKWPDDEFLAVA